MKRPEGADRPYAPELDGALAWLNIERPLTMSELRGCVVLLDFWTYCCINCMHVIPTLREIEQRHAGDPLVVIGVHSGKFSAEHDPDRIMEAIGRYGVEHPVVVDDDMAIWSRFDIRSWPTIVVVGADGRVAAVAPGEPALETLDAFIEHELELARKEGSLALSPPRLSDGPLPDHKPLLYPGKARALSDGRIAVSDSGHHRVILCQPDGKVLLVAGSGIRGWVDGPAIDAAFDDPQGVCWHEGALYVADSRNHAIRRIEVESQQVTTVAGTGALGDEAPQGRAKATEVALRSPWDLCAVDGAIYVAMAGGHQIWRFWPDAGEIELYAGSGVEALLDGDVVRSAWAQPSGLSERDGILYVADSETSAVRAIDLAAGQVHTLVGQGLFDFGDEEGDAEAALLQHCLGVAATGDGVLIADTYNGKIKRWRGGIDEVGTITTVLDGLSEPGSVSVTRDGLWLVSDTNAHRILAVREGAISELRVSGAPEPRRGAIEAKRADPLSPAATRGWFTSLLELPEGSGLAPGGGVVELSLSVPPGMGIAPGSPLSASVEVSRRSDLLLLARQRLTIEAEGGSSQRLAIDVAVTDLPGPKIEAELVATIDYVACRDDDHAACTPGRLHLRVPVRLLEGGAERLGFEVALPALEG